MQIWNMSPIQVRAALSSIDQHLDDIDNDSIKFGANVIFKREPERTGSTDRAPVACTLRTVDARGYGSRRSHSGRRMPVACFHVHAAFYRACFAAGATRIKSAIADWRTLDQFEESLDRLAADNIGSIAEPLCHADACDCEHE